MYTGVIIENKTINMARGELFIYFQLDRTFESPIKNRRNQVNDSKGETNVLCDLINGFDKDIKKVNILRFKKKTYYTCKIQIH